MTELTPEARRTLMAARAAADPTAADKERVKVLLAAALATTTGLAATATTAAAQSTAKAGVVLGAKFAIGGLALGLAVATGVALMLPQAPASSASRPAVASHTPADPAAHETVVPPAPQHAPAPLSITSNDSTSPLPHRATSTRAARRTHIAHVAEEVAWIGKAETALEAGQLRDALRALDAHARQFSDGQLQPERLGLRAIVLCTMSDSRGRTEATRFLRHHPWSAMTGRVRSACLPSLTGNTSSEESDEP